MTDVYSFEGLDNVVDLESAQRRRVAADVMQAYDFDPEDAARAKELSALTGDPASVIGQDTKAYESQLQRVTGSRIVTSSDVLRDWVQSGAMNAAMGQDDWDKLSDYEQALKNIGHPDKPGYASRYMGFLSPNVLGAAYRGWTEAYETHGGPFDKSIEDIESYMTRTYDKFKPFGLGLMTTAPWYVGDLALNTANKAFRILGALSGAVYEGIIEHGLEMGLNPYDAKRAAKELASMAEWAMIDLPMHAELPGITTKPARERFGEPGVDREGAWLRQIDPRMPTVQKWEQLAPIVQRHMAPIIEAQNLAKPYIEAGEEIPPGLHPVWDEVLKEATKEEQKALADAQKAADKTNLKERSPDSLAEITQRALGERYVHVDVDAIHSLYGGKAPAPNDGLLGWVPNINRIMYDNLLDGERVAIPIEQWINNTTPEIRQALKDDITIRAIGNTANDWALQPKPAELPFRERWNENSDATRLWDAVESIRKANKLEPLPAVGKIPERLQLIRGGKQAPWGDELKGEHSFMITDEIGQHVADLEIDTRNNGKDLFVKWIGGRYIPHQVQQPVTNIFGPTLMRDLFRQIRDQFPEAETISGRRTSGAREGTLKEGGEVKINLEALRAELEDPARLSEEVRQFMDIAESGEWKNLTNRVMYKTALRDDLPVSQQKLFDDLNAIAMRILPKEMRGRIRATKSLLLDGRPQYGLFQPYSHEMPLIAWSLNLEDVGAIRHEAMHFLKAYGYISDKEWATLTRAAEEGGWIEKHLGERPSYHSLSLSEKTEEAIAFELMNWSRSKPATAYSGVFGRISRLLEEIRDYFKELFGREVTAEDVFQRIERGTVARRPMGEVAEGYFDPRFTRLAGPLPPKAAAPKQPMLPGVIPLHERPVHEPGALMPAARQKLYEREIEKQRTRDIELQERAATKQIKQEANQTWLDEAAKREPKIREEVLNSPGFAIDRLFREGMLYDVKVDKRPRIQRDLVPEAYLDEIPQNWLAKKGENPDQLAGLFGLGSGEEFLDAIAQFQLSRGELGPKRFLEKMVGLRLQREMEREFGERGDMIKKMAEDHVFDDGQLGMLHQDTLAMAAKLGQEHSFTKNDVVRQMAQRLNELLMKDANFKNTTHALYRAGGKLEDALLRGNAIEAYRQVQRKENAFALAVGIKKLEREQTAHERLVKAYRKRIPEGRDQEITPFIHDVLERIGESSRPRSDINTEMAASPYKNLAGLDEHLWNEQGLRLVPDFLLDPNWRKDPRLMTVEEWRGVNDFLTFMDKFSRETNTIRVIDERWNLRDTIDNKMVPAIERGYPKLRATGEYALTAPEPGIAKRSARAFMAQSLHMETVFNWFDRNHPKGIFNQAIVRDYVTAANRSDALDKEFGNLLGDLTKIKNPHRLVSQTIFKHPDTGEPLQLTRMHILGILQNMGNPSNFYTMLDGYKIPREMGNAVLDLVFKHVTQEDVVRAMELGKIFKQAKDMSDRMYRQLTGVAPMNIDVWSIQTPFKKLGQNGLIEGWYHPLIHDTRFKQTSEKLAAPSPLEFPVWTKSNLPAAGYTKERTGYKGPITLELDGFQNRLHMIIRDVAWRPALTQMQKIFKDPEFRRAIRDHWGPHYESLLDPFLKDIAGQREVMDANSAWGMQVAQFIRQNIVSHMVGLNPATIAKHTVTAAVQSITEVGIADFSRALFSLLARNPETGERNWTFAVNKSEELQRRHRNALEGITSNFNQTFGHLKTSADMREYLNSFQREGLSYAARLAISDFKGKFLTLRDWLHYYEAWPMAFFDMLSAVPVWLARYRQAKMAGENEGNAIFMSDRAVRYAHGSSAITTRPQLMRQNAMAMLFGNFYTFFSHILQRQVMTAWASRAGLRGEGVYLRQPGVRADGEVIPPELEQAKKGRHHAEETEGEYQKTDDYKQGMSMVGPLVGMFVAYYLFPAWWDEVVSPMHGEKGIGPEKDESALWYATKVQVKGLGGSWIGARDILHGMVEGGDVSAGLWGEFGKYIMSITRDVRKTQKKMSTEEKQNFIKHVNGIWNSASGVGLPNSIPRTGIFGANWYYRTEHPKGVREWWTGITKGTAHPRHH